MFHRIPKLSKSNSFFLFGGRATGKSTLIRDRYASRMASFNLLEDEILRRYLRSADRLRDDIKALGKKPEWIFIDEIQKAPRLLDVVHDLIEKERLKFILTGSSARKLRRQSANLLAGRAFVYNLFPLTARELGDAFDLNEVLNWGSLPHIFSLREGRRGDRVEYLRAYAQTYLKEEILQEQLVRNGAAFQDFLEISSQENGKALNYSKIARDIGVDVKTIQNFFAILEDTLVAFRLPAFHRSVRKTQLQHPKFYLFDLGVKRAMERSLDQPIQERTSAFGTAFEHFIICEVLRLNEYSRADYRLSHYQTSQGAEVDLVLSKARTLFAVEIKSSDRVDEVEVRRFARNSEPLRATAKYYVSRDPVASVIDGVECLHWSEFLERLF